MRHISFTEIVRNEKLTELNDQADNHADDDGPLWRVERVVAYILNVFVWRAVDAILDECFAGLSEEEDDLEDIKDDLHASRPSEIVGVGRE